MKPFKKVLLLTLLFPFLFSYSLKSDEVHSHHFNSEKSLLHSSSNLLQTVCVRGGVINMRKRKQKFDRRKSKQQLVNEICHDHSILSGREEKKRRLKNFLALVAVDSVILGLVNAKTLLVSKEAGEVGLVERAFYAMVNIFIITLTAANPNILKHLWTRDSPKDDLQTIAFKQFQSNFISVQALSTFTTLIQGAYLYKIFHSYGYELKDTSILYLSSYISSLSTGFAVGKLIDRYGRRRACIVQLLLSILQCQLLRFKDFRVLLLGRIISGFCTSLSTSYECWMISEHMSRNFLPNLILDTFTKSTLVITSISVISGILTGALEKRGFGLMKIINLSSLVSLLCILLITRTWTENYGHHGDLGTEKEASAFQTLKKMSKDPKIIFLGITQCMFDSTFMLSSFMRTPLLLALAKDTPLNLGLVFSTGMISAMVGSLLPKIFGGSDRRVTLSTEQLLMGLTVLGAATMASIVFQTNLSQLLAAFLVFNVVVGGFFPLMASLRAKHIPENVRATVTNVYKVSTNSIVVSLLLGPLRASSWTVEKKQAVVFGIGTLAMCVCLLSQTLDLFLNRRKNATNK